MTTATEIDTETTDAETTKWWSGHGRYRNERGLWRLIRSNVPLNINPATGCLHRGDCHGPAAGRPLIPEFLLPVLWEGEHIRVEADKDRLVYFCDRVSRRVQAG